MAPQVGLEPTTLRLTAGCSAIELLRSVVLRDFPFNNSIDAADWESASLLWKCQDGTTRGTLVPGCIFDGAARGAQDLINSARERISFNAKDEPAYRQF
jgi:hypothetical protein